MIISVNWLKKFTSIDIPVDELASLIGERLVEIESVEYIGEKYKDVLIAKVIHCEPLQGSNHLSVAQIDDGGVRENVARNDDGLIQVVCGAPNVRAGIFVAWLPPKSIVPETYNNAEPFVLEARPLMGVVSNGMIASARELDLYDEHDGILEIDTKTSPGASFSELYELDDYLLDIDNKSLTHRPDVFGVIGFAREVAGIQGKKFNTPDWLNNLTSNLNQANSLVAPNVKIEDSSLSDRFQAVVISNINEQAKSPIDIQCYLARSGVRPINAMVDVSNYLMLLTGQPSHAYDYDKLKAVAGDDFTLRVRLARDNETLVMLDGKNIELNDSDIVIAAGDHVIGLAGVMGGQSTMVDSNTKSVVIEVATFDLYHMRSSQMRHGIFSEAVTRFTKGISAPLSSPVLAQAAALIAQYTGATIASPVIEDYPNPYEPIVVKVSEQKVNEILGTHFSAEDILETLENVGFEVEFEDLLADVRVPYWRKDIHIPEDIVEEVGRLIGFDTIGLSLPVRDFVAIKPTDFDQFKVNLRGKLVRSGANEVLTYSFVHGDLFNKVSQDSANAYKIVNSISPDLQYYRQSLIPNLLSNIFANVKAGYPEFGLFEFNKVHRKNDGLTDESVPVESHSMAYVITRTNPNGDAYYEAKQVLEYAISTYIGEVRYEPIKDTVDPAEQPFEPLRSSRVIHVETGKVVGVLGEFKKSVQKAFKLNEYTAGFELNTKCLFEVSSNNVWNYASPSRYPSVARDICFQVSTDTTYETVASSAKEVLEKTNLAFSLEPIDIYQPESKEFKNITISVNLVSHQKTMVSDEVSKIINDIANNVTQHTNGRVI